MCIRVDGVDSNFDIVMILDLDSVYIDRPKRRCKSSSLQYRNCINVQATQNVEMTLLRSLISIIFRH